MSPSHAKKRNGKRYRYYVSQALLQNRDDAGSIARVPAHAMEDLVVRRLRQHLSDTDRRAWQHLPGDDEATRWRAVLRRVVVKLEEVEIIVADPRCWGNGAGVEFFCEDEDEQIVTIGVPIRIKSWGRERTILTLDGTEQFGHGQPDTALIKAIVRAHHWQEMLEQGEVRSVAELAATLGHHPSYVGSLLGLAFLAPDIVDAILSGRQPRNLGVGALIACKPLSTWQTQRRLLGFGSKI